MQFQCQNNSVDNLLGPVGLSHIRRVQYRNETSFCLYFALFKFRVDILLPVSSNKYYRRFSGIGRTADIL